MDVSDLRMYASEVSDLARRMEADGLDEQASDLHSMALGLDMQADEEERHEMEEYERHERRDHQCRCCGAHLDLEGHDRHCENNTEGE